MSKFIKKTQQLQIFDFCTAPLLDSFHASIGNFCRYHVESLEGAVTLMKSVTFKLYSQSIIIASYVASLTCVMTLSDGASAQSQTKSKTTDISNSGAKKDAKETEDDDNIIKKPKETSEPVAKEFTNGEKNKACARFNGKLVSVSGEMWKIKDCKRHQVNDADLVFRLSRQGTPVVEADARELAAIPIGETWDIIHAGKARSCSVFNGKYITLSYTDIYFVDRCIRRLIPDYETLLKHRRDRKDRSTDILAVSDVEFHAIKQGRDLPSEVDREFSKLIDGSAGVDIIPVDEACRGVEGKLVSFYSRLYRIEKCRKREIDAESFTMKRRALDAKIVELKPEQWLSLPDGKPLETK